jgi:hypothetical protein
MAGGGVTFLPVTVMSIRLIAGVEGVEVRAGVEVCADVGDDVVGNVDEAGPVWEQDVRTSAALRPRAAVKRLCTGVVFVTVGSLGRFV